MPLVVANPDANLMRREGFNAFRSGIREKADVLRDYWGCKRGTASEYHYAEGYREAAREAWQAVGDALEWVNAVPMGLDNLPPEAKHVIGRI